MVTTAFLYNHEKAREFSRVNQTATGETASNKDCTHRCTCAPGGELKCEEYACATDELCVAVEDAGHACVKPAQHCLVWGAYVKQFAGFRFPFKQTGKFVAVQSVNTFLLLFVLKMPYCATSCHTFTYRLKLCGAQPSSCWPQPGSEPASLVFNPSV